MRITIRMDDITPEMDWPRFLRVKKLLDQYQIIPAIGVVPDNRDEKLSILPECQKGQRPENFWEYIRELQKEDWVIAQHGFRHLYESKCGGLFPLNGYSEFAGLPYEVQLRKLAEGKRILEEHHILTRFFMAPGHSYDKNTLKALHRLGFTGVTDGFGSCPYRLYGLNFYPISFHMGLSRKKKYGITTMVLHTNTMSEEEFASLENLLKSGSCMSYPDYLEEEPVRRRLPGRTGEYLLASAKRCIMKAKG